MLAPYFLFLFCFFGTMIELDRFKWLEVLHEVDKESPKRRAIMVKFKSTQKRPAHTNNSIHIMQRRNDRHACNAKKKL